MSQSSRRHHNLRLSIRHLSVGEIKPNPRDPRAYKKRDLRRFAKNLDVFGPIVPQVLNSDGVTLSGNVWIEAAKLAGLETLPTVTADHLTADEAEFYMVSSVRLIELGEWNKPLLGEILRDLSLKGLDLSLDMIGFDVAEIDMLIEGQDDPGVADDEADELPPAGPAVSRPGYRWTMGPHELFCGNALEPATFDALMLGATAAIVFTDPPYNVRIPGNVSGLGAVKHRDFAMATGEMNPAQFTQFLEGALGLATRHSADGSLHYIAMDWRHMYELIVAGQTVYDSLQNLCVWSKAQGGMGSLYRSQHELFFVFKKGRKPHRNNVQLGRYGRNRTNVWTYPGANSFGRQSDEGDLLKLHPTVKPVALIVDILLDASARGEIVLDPFIGSGSTLIAAEKVGRHARGIEIDPLYVDTAVRRWERWTGEAAILDGDGRTFREIEADRAREAANDV